MTKPLVIITGASSGIGLALAKAFSNAGYALGLFARSLEPMQALNLANSHCHSVDVTQMDTLKTALEITENKFGPVNCLINSAGYLDMGEFASIPHEHHERMIHTNLLGTLNTIEVVLPGMQARKNGTIINLSSLSDRNSRPLYATYAATKAAVKSLSESLRMGNAQHGIRICSVAPGPTATPMIAAANLHKRANMKPSDLAKFILSIYELPQDVCVRDVVIAPTLYEP